MVSEDSLSASVFPKATNYASDMAVRSVWQPTSGDVLLHYDEKTGRLISMSSPNRTTTFKYDAIGRLIALERPRMDA